MHTDSFFHIGKTHDVCQDYTENGGDYAILSDGCSSAPNTNIGSLLLCRAAKMFLEKFAGEYDPSHILASAYSYANALSLNEESLYATLLYLKLTDRIKINVCGDGVIAARKRNTSIWKVTEFNYPSGAPFYLAYQLDKLNEECYFNTFSDQLIITTYDFNCLTGDVVNKIIEKTKAMWNVVQNYSVQEYDMAVLLSDGVASFYETIVSNTSKSTKTIPITTILKEVLNFKNYGGEFVKRRCKAAFRQFQEMNWHNSDDFSMSGIYVPFEKE